MASTKTSKLCRVGLALYKDAVEAAIFSDTAPGVVKSVRFPAMVRLFDDAGEILVSPEALQDAIQSALELLGEKVPWVHLSLPASLLTQVEVAKVPPKMLKLALESELERYRTFEGTGPALGYAIQEHLPAPEGRQGVVLSAIRHDTLTGISKALTASKVKVRTVDVHEVDLLRAMAGTGVLDGLVGQLGPEAKWGALILEFGRARLSVWQGSTLVAMQEASVNDPPEAYGAALSPMQLEDLAQALGGFLEQVPTNFWFVQGIADESVDMLSQRVGLPMRPALWSSGFSVAPLLEGGQPRVETIGASLRDWVSFPFELQYASLHKNLFKSSRGVLGFLSVKNDKPEAPAMPMMEDEGAQAGLLMMAMVAGLVTVGVTTAGLYAAGLMAKSEQDKLTIGVEASKSSIATLDAQLAVAQDKNKVQQAVRDLILEAQGKNRLYTQLGADLKSKVPETLWLESTAVGSTLEFKGKAVRHQDVLLFARRFDDAQYLKSLLIQKIEEAMLKESPVFEFEIKADIQPLPQPALPVASALSLPGLAASAGRP